MTRTPKQAEAERVSRTRAAMRAQALLMGWTPLDLLGAYVTPDNHVIIVTRDGGRVEAELSAPVGEARVENVIPITRPKRVYAPKSWAAGTWNHTVESVRTQQLSKADVIAKLTEQDKGTDSKQLKQALAVIDAMPDTPDWFAGLPVADEPGSEV